MKLVLGTRGSALARAQTDASARRLRSIGFDVEVRILSTKGDQQSDVPFAQVGSAGVFVRELETALQAREIDLAVHSYKDLPSESPDDLVVAAVPERVDAADVLVAKQPLDRGLAGLPPAARVGTASARRRALVLDERPDLVVGMLRGNVPTRLRKLREGEHDAIVLAAAGLDRLRVDARQRGEDFDLLEGLVVARLDPARFVPAPTQGALAWQTRREDIKLRERLGECDDEARGGTIAAERELLRRIGGGCDLPFGAWCEVTASGLRMHSFMAGSGLARSRVEGDEPEALAARSWEQLRAAGAGS